MDEKNSFESVQKREELDRVVDSMTIENASLKADINYIKKQVELQPRVDQPCTKTLCETILKSAPQTQSVETKSRETKLRPCVCECNEYKKRLDEQQKELSVEITKSRN